MSIVPKVIEQDQLVSHYPYELGASLKMSLEAMRRRLANRQDEGLSEMLEQLSETPVGRFLIVNQGLNGYWWDQIARYPLRPKPKQTEIETHIFERSPRMMAIQEAFANIQSVLQQVLKDGISLASIPCGVAADLLTLDYSGMRNVSLTAVDLDYESLTLAHDVAVQQQLTDVIRFIQEDIWDLTLQQQFHAVVSSGFLPYMQNDSQISRFLKIMHDSLVPGGLLLLPFWSDAQVTGEHALTDNKIFNEILQIRWYKHLTPDEMSQLLRDAGFRSVDIVMDSRGLYPLALATS